MSRVVDAPLRVAVIVEMDAGAIIVEPHALATFGAPRAFGLIGTITTHAVMTVTILVVGSVAFNAFFVAGVTAYVATSIRVINIVGRAAGTAGGCVL